MILSILSSHGEEANRTLHLSRGGALDDLHILVSIVFDLMYISLML